MKRYLQSGQPSLDCDRRQVCAVCGQPLRETSRIRLQRAYLLQCTCKSWTYFPRPNPLAQAAIHDSADYFDHPYFQQRRSAHERIDRRCRMIFQQIESGMELSALSGERVLDVGCDTGALLASAARQYGIQPLGVDVSARAVNAANQQGILAYHTDLEHAPESLKDLAVITAIDVIEHVVDPHSLLQAIYARLRPGGVAYLETPNIESSVYQVGRSLCNLTGGYPTSLCERLFPAQHIQYFTARSFHMAIAACGFEVVQLQKRILPPRDIAASVIVQIGLAPLQFFDRLTGNEILLCALLRKPF